MINGDGRDNLTATCKSAGWLPVAGATVSSSKKTPPPPWVGSEGVRGIKRRAGLQRAQERLQVLPLPVREVDVEPLLVVADGLLDVLRRAVVEVRRARGETAQRRHAERTDLGPQAAALTTAEVADPARLHRDLV